MPSSEPRIDHLQLPESESRSALARYHFFNSLLNRLVRRGLERGYVVQVEDTRSPRGRLLLDDMIKRQTLLRGEAVCQYDDLRTDVLNNQILKATARLLARSASLLPEYRHQLNVLVRSLETISDVRLSAGLFSRTQLTRNNRDYRLLLRLCEFVFHAQLPDQAGESSRFADILMDELRMSSVCPSSEHLAQLAA